MIMYRHLSKRGIKWNQSTYKREIIKWDYQIKNYRELLLEAIQASNVAEIWEMVNTFSIFPNENELLSPRNSKFLIKGIDQVDNIILKMDLIK